MTGLEELDEADIEEEIRRELEALDNLDLESFSEAKNDKTPTTEFTEAIETTNSIEKKYVVPPDSVETFIRLLKSKNDKLAEELADAQDALKLTSHESIAVARDTSDEDETIISPETKEKVLHEIEELETADKGAAKTFDDEHISSLEEIALRNLQELEVKQYERDDQLKHLFNEMKEDEMLRFEKEERVREENKRKAKEEHKMKMDKNQSVKIKIEEEARWQRKKLEDLQKHFDAEMKDLERMQKQEKIAFEKMKRDEERKHEIQKERACVTIQKHFRTFRVLSKYGETLRMKRQERRKERQEELDALERKEKILMEEAMKKAKEEEMKRLKEIEMEKRRKEEEERKRKEEEKRRVEEERRKKLEEEQKREKERKMRLEMERHEKEEQERKMKEERKRKEDETRQEEERRRIEEEKRLEEQKRIEEQKKLEEQKKEQEELERIKQKEKERRKKEMEEKTKEDGEDFEGKSKETEKSQTKIKENLSKEQTRKQEKYVLKGDEKLKNDLFLERKHDSGLKEAGYLSVVKNTNSRSFNKTKDSSTEPILVSKEHHTDIRLSQTLRKKDNDNCSNESAESLANVCEYSELSVECEKRREKWLKTTTLWSTLSQAENSNLKSKSRPRRPLSASQKLQSISEEELLKSSNRLASLDQIVCISVKDLPPRNLKILSKCTSAKSVTIQKCSLLSAENFDNCKRLIELNLSDNSIQNISCQNVEALESLDVRNNQLTSIHGLDGCSHLRSLHLDGNKITRLGSFQSNRVVHLSLQSNQLITTKGLSTWRYLQTLDCSNNHLSQVQDLAACPLLRILKLRGNNLRKPPDLGNHVLLRDLYLGENSISSLDNLASQWLPLLQRLFVDNNSLSNLCPLSHLPMLETLDIRNNLISDEENLVPGLVECHQLRILNMAGNPVCEDSNIRSGVVKALPSLRLLDGESLENAVAASCVKTIFYPICHAQITAQNDLLARHKGEIENCQGEINDDQVIVKRLTVQSRHFQELQDLMIKHRLQHECFTISNTQEEPVKEDAFNRASVSRSLSPPSKKDEHDNKVKQHENVESHFSCSESGRQNSSSTSDHIRASGTSKPEQHVKPEESTATLVWKPSDHMAATRIQARFRGYRIRKRYLEATKTAQYSDIDLEEDEFNFDEEVDLNMFDMDEAALESSWAPVNTSQTTRQREELLPQQKVEVSDPAAEASLHDTNYRPFPRKQAWRSPNSPISSPNPRKVIPPIAAPSVLSEQTSPPGETHRSHRTSELSSEWGFQKDTTAELMLKRAKRMKYNALRKKKLTDPEKRLQLFKKADETNKTRGVQTVQKKKEKPRVDYFSGRPYVEQETSKKDEEETRTKKEMTFSWVYDQAVLHEDQGEEILRDTRGYFSESSRPVKNKADRSPPVVSLPRMDPVILAGRNLPLVASPVSNPRTPSMHSGDVEHSSYRKHIWQQARTHSNPDLTRSGVSKLSESRSGKSNSAEARIIKERNHIL